MAYLVAAYLIIWLASFILIFSMVRRQRTMKAEINLLKGLLEDKRAVELNPGQEKQG